MITADEKDRSDGSRDRRSVGGRAGVCRLGVMTMFLAMKMKLVMAVAALAAPIALTVAPVPSVDRPAADYHFCQIAAAKLQ